jgi:hypothetical protein
MQGTNGRQLVEQATKKRCVAKVVLMSGYTDDLAIRTCTAAMFKLLRKPFIRALLATLDA